MSEARSSGPLLTLAALALLAGGAAGWLWWRHKASPVAPPTRTTSGPASQDPERRRGDNPRLPQPVEDPADVPRTNRPAEESGRNEADRTSRATELASTLATLDGAGRAELIVRATTGDSSPEVCEVAASQVIADALGGSDRPMSREQRAACCAPLLASLAPTQPIEARRPSIVAILAAGTLEQVQALRAWLEREETNAVLRAWALDAARTICDARGERSEKVLRGLTRGLELETR